MKAAIYCRVSTEDIVQKNSLNAQITEAEAAVCEKGWDLSKIYIDDGKTGTLAEKREAYLQMLEDMQNGLLDVIVVKSLDRLMRSAKDWYLFADLLLKFNLKLYFYMEQKFYKTDDFLLVGVRALLAEEFSRELSKKANAAHKSRQGKGKALLSSGTWGYDVLNGNIIINEKEAEMVRLIYSCCADGMGLNDIQVTLRKYGYFSRSGKTIAISTIRDILRNHLFKGTAVLNQAHYDFNKKKYIRVEKKDWITVEGAVPPIVSSELWEKANNQLDFRSTVVGNRRIGKKKGKSPLSGKIFCGQCGSVYWYRKGKVPSWVCKEYVMHGTKGCTNRVLNCDLVDKNLLALSKRFFICKEEMIGNAMTILNETLVNESGLRKSQIEQTKEKLFLLNKKFKEGIIERNTYRKKVEELEKRIKQLEKNTEDTLGERLEVLKNAIIEIVNEDMAFQFLCEQIDRIEVYTDKVMCKSKTFVIENLLEYGENH